MSTENVVFLDVYKSSRNFEGECWNVPLQTDLVSFVDSDSEWLCHLLNVCLGSSLPDGRVAASRVWLAAPGSADNIVHQLKVTNFTLVLTKGNFLVWG